MRLWLIMFVSVVVTAFAWHDSETIYNHGENYACMAQDKKMKNKTIFTCFKVLAQIKIMQVTPHGG